MEYSTEKCLQVKDIPLHKRITVFNKGTSYHNKGTTPVGGHLIPTSIEGANLKWKNAQKNEKNNITSLTIKRNIPIFKPFITSIEWSPLKVDSPIISRTHIKDTTANSKNETIIKYPLLDTNLTGRPIAANLANTGQGLTSNKWNGVDRFITIKTISILK